ncbi:unnamed protein product [Symbiodinium sp. CCMP2592]|nr:unnamed protein product [Symbiodinium sp. CCMP2592]
MCDLGYDEGVSDKMAAALSFYRPSALAEAARESLLGALQQTFPNDVQRVIMAQSLYDRIQKHIAQPQPVQSDVSENVKAFAHALDDAQLEGQILKTETGSFKLEQDSEIWDETKFYVRGCYTEIADIMLKTKPHRMSLLGSSGIGKSNFMVYLIWRRFQDDKLKEFPVFLHQRDIIHRIQKGEEPKKVDAATLYSAPQQALHIMDADIDVEHGALSFAQHVVCIRLLAWPASFDQSWQQNYSQEGWPAQDPQAYMGYSQIQMPAAGDMSASGMPAMQQGAPAAGMPQGQQMPP